jgi:acetyl-CoA carboxylase carboxyl transferase alpha subunit
MAYVRAILDQFVELHGDRLKSDDRSIVAGVGYLAGEPVAVIGQQRAPQLDGERSHTFPDGLRKAQRIIGVASHFGLPLITLVDTQGADPGLQAEEQGIGNAIANTLSVMAGIPTPVVSVIIGEGGSEGALALGLSDRVLMQENAIYSPVSLNHNLGGPYPNPALNREAAETLMLTAPDCLELAIIDTVVPEPEQGAHTDPREAAQLLKTSLVQEFAQLSRLSPGKLLRERYRKFRRMGELSSHSQEAMNREIELLMNLSQEAMNREIELLMNLSPRKALSDPKEEPSDEADAPIPLSD